MTEAKMLNHAEAVPHVSAINKANYAEYFDRRGYASRTGARSEPSVFRRRRPIPVSSRPGAVGGEGVIG